MNHEPGVPEYDPGSLADEYQPDDSRRWSREHFIPIRKADLIRHLLGSTQFSADDHEQLTKLCRLLDANLKLEADDKIEQLHVAYSPLDPDEDMKETRELTDQERRAFAPAVFDQFVAILTAANYTRLDEEELRQSLDVSSPWGMRLHLDFDTFERLEVFARGDIMARRTTRRMTRLYREEHLDVPIYQRLVVMFQLREGRPENKDVETTPVYLKLFKNIPKQDMDMLLPGARIRMSWFDQTKILVPTLSGVALTGWKIIAHGAIAIALSSLNGFIIFCGLVAGLLGYAVKSFFGYMHTKTSYQLTLTRSLYYQNLDNNAGVIFRVLHESAEQEFREAILSYYLLWRSGGESGWTSHQIDRQAEKFLHEVIDVQVDFEVHDAVAKLERLGLVTKVDGQRWQAVPIPNALERLSEKMMIASDAVPNRPV